VVFWDAAESQNGYIYIPVPILPKCAEGFKERVFLYVLYVEEMLFLWPEP
jgi:hypothetical protein